MLVSCALQAFAPHPISDALPVIRDAGLKHVEVGWRQLRPVDESPCFPDEGHLARLAAQLEHHGLRAASLSLIGGPTIADMDDAPRFPENCWRTAQRLGVRLVVVDTGRTTDESETIGLLARLARWGDEAAASGLMLAVENRPGPCVDGRGMQQWMERLAHPAVRLHFDTGGYACRNPWSSWEVALQRVCGWLGGVRLTDHAGEAGDERYPALGEGGTIDFARTLEILKGIRFRHPCTIDFRLRKRRRGGMGGESTVAIPIEKLRAGLERCVTQLRRSGWFC
jgi:L-ribulose-5-phosphate 3-epimerase